MDPVYMRALIGHRVPEIDLDDLAATHPAAPPAEPDLPVEIGQRILEVLEVTIERLDRLAAVIAPDDPLARCRLALDDLTVEAKRRVMTELDSWVTLEEASHDPAAAPGRQH